MANFKKLDVWQESRELTTSTIRVCGDMNTAISSIVRGQIVRSIMSVPANIAEGSAKRSDREFARFVRIALGSATETESHLIIASDLELVARRDFESLSSKIVKVQKMLSGLDQRLTLDADKKSR